MPCSACSTMQAAAAHLLVPLRYNLLQEVRLALSGVRPEAQHGEEGRYTLAWALVDDLACNNMRRRMSNHTHSCCTTESWTRALHILCLP